MLAHYLEFVFLFVGAEMILKTWFSPWASVICGAFIFVLSVIKLFG